MFSRRGDVKQLTQGLPAASLFCAGTQRARDYLSYRGGLYKQLTFPQLLQRTEHFCRGRQEKVAKIVPYAPPLNSRVTHRRPAPSGRSNFLPHRSVSNFKITGSACASNSGPRSHKELRETPPGFRQTTIRSRAERTFQAKLQRE